MLHPELTGMIRTLAQQYAKNATQEHHFLQGAEAMGSLIEQLGVEATLMPRLQDEVQRLFEAITYAEKLRRDLAALALPDALDARGRAIAVLTTHLTEQLMKTIGQTAHGHSLDTSTRNAIVRTVSYLVWGYLNPGQPLVNLEINDKEDGPLNR